MTIPTVESLRRRSSCAIKIHPPRPVSRAHAQTALDHADLPTQRISRASRSPPIRARREQQKHKTLEAQAAVPFTHVSNFHSRKLPPLGTLAHNLDPNPSHVDPFQVGLMVPDKHQNPLTIASGRPDGEGATISPKREPVDRLGDWDYG
jgi:hypothetical protein